MLTFCESTDLQKVKHLFSFVIYFYYLVNLLEVDAMDATENRRKNLQTIRENYPSNLDLANALSISPSLISQALNGKRTIGAKMARNIEITLNLPAGYMEVEHYGVEDRPPATSNVQEDKAGYKVDPLQGYSFIQQYDNALAAGHSAINEFDNPKDALAFKSEWLKRKGLCPDNLVIVYATGDSMEPVIREKDVLMIDTSQKAIIDGKIYGFTSGDGARVKQLFQKTGGGLKVCSLNKAHYDEDLTAEEAASINIIGRVVWCGGEI